MKIHIEKVIDGLLFLYILTLYFITSLEGYHLISNIVAALLMALIWFHVITNREKIVINGLLVWLFVFNVVCVFSYFIALDQNLVFVKVITLFQLLALAASVVNYLNSADKIIAPLKYFFYSGFLTSAYILLTADFTKLTRFGSDLGNVNAVGMMVSISIIFGFYFIITDYKIAYIPMIMTMVPVVFLTGSRKALLFLLFNLLMVIYFNYRTSIAARIKSLIIIAIILFASYQLIFSIPIFYEIIGVRMENLASFVFGEGTSEGSITTREQMIRYGLKFWSERPLLGYGIDNFRTLYGYSADRVTYAHNNYIEIAVGTGIIGLFAYYMTHFSVMISLFKSKREGSKILPNYLFFSIILSYALIALSLVYYYDKTFTLILALASVSTAEKKITDGDVLENEQEIN